MRGWSGTGKGEAAVRRGRLVGGHSCGSFPADERGMSFFSPRVVAPRAVRLCVLGSGAALVAAALPWQSWDGGMLTTASGPPLLATGCGLTLAAAAFVVLFVSLLRPAMARTMLWRARARAAMAVAAAVAWVTPLPFGPELPPSTRAVIHWSLWYQAGAVGAVVAAIGAVWWAKAVARAVCARPFRRALGRARRPRVTVAAAGSAAPLKGTGTASTDHGVTVRPAGA